jgi:hypothetical protein
MRVFRANLVRHGQDFGEFGAIDARIRAGFAQRREYLLGGNVPYQIVSRKRAAA